VSGGTDNHLMLVDVTPLGVTGKEAEALLDEIGSPSTRTPSVRQAAAEHLVGHPGGYAATTTRGFGADEMRAIGRLIVDAIAARDEPAAQARLPPKSTPSSTDSRCPACPHVKFVPAAGDVLPIIVVAFAVALAISYLLTPAVRRLAIRLRMVDRPDERR